MLIILALLILRIVQRLWYTYNGVDRKFKVSSSTLQGQHGIFEWRFDPRSDLESWLKHHDINWQCHTFKTSDGVTIEYRRIGRGGSRPQRVIYLCNGVGTNLNMWLPVFMHLLSKSSEGGDSVDFFSNMTIIAPSYRGLFGSQSDSPVRVTFDNCVRDINEVLEHAEVKRVSCMIGWSTGAQIILKYVQINPNIAEKLFLLNPACGQALHTVFQPVIPLPGFMGKCMSLSLNWVITTLRPVCQSQIWNLIKEVAVSDALFVGLTVFAFACGFPPEQPSYFMAYIEDTFASRYHTQHLLDLITGLDTPLSSAARCHPHRTTIVTGLTDVMTGCYHGESLALSMRNQQYKVMLMGSHFLLIEFPDEVAQLILDLMSDELKRLRDRVDTKVKNRMKIVKRILEGKS